METANPTAAPSTTPFEQLHSLSSVVARWEKELASSLQGESLGRSIEQAISGLREAYQDIIFLDYDYALKHDVEGKIWEKHHTIIRRYRSNITHLRDLAGKKKPVELRKMMTHFVNFLRASTKFYRSYIQRLASHFGIYELGPVVRQFKLSMSTPDNSMACTPERKQSIIRSCHRSLVILGDLSRYREISSGSSKNWAPATGYYDLAKKLVPDCGSPHNQLAVISISDGSNFSATYHLYKALSVIEPFAMAENNLLLGFQKVLKAYKNGKLGYNLVRKEEQAVSDLLSLFVRFHAKCFSGKGTSELEALQEEMLAQLNMDLKERSLSEGMLNKLVLINIAAQAYASKRNTGIEATKSVGCFLRLNVETFNTLLLIFQPELERAVTTGGKPGNSAESISAVGRRMLPALRLYSKWLLIYHSILSNQLDDTTLAVQIKQLWQTFANTLSLLATTFVVENLPNLDYALDEDEEIIGFLPLSTGRDIESEEAKRKFILDDGHKNRVHPNEEMLARVLYLLQDGMKLCANEDVPIAVVDGTITYQEDGILASTPSIGMKSLYRPVLDYDEITSPGISPNMYGNVNSPLERPISLQVGGGSIIESIAPSESASLNVAMNRMVDSLVGPREPIVSEEDEEEERIVFTGRNKRGTTLAEKIGQHERSPNRQNSMKERTIIENAPTPGLTVHPATSTATYTAKDLVNQLHTYTQRARPLTSLTRTTRSDWGTHVEPNHEPQNSAPTLENLPFHYDGPKKFGENLAPFPWTGQQNGAPSNRVQQSYPPKYPGGQP